MKQYYVLGHTYEWCYYSWKGAFSKDPSIHYINTQLPFKGNRLSRFIAQCFFSSRVNRRIKLPFKSLFYRQIAEGIGLRKENENYLIIYDGRSITLDFNFFNFLRQEYKGIKIVYLFSNIVQKSSALGFGIVDKIGKVFDIVFAFDKLDSAKYGYEFFPLIYTKNNEFLTDEPCNIDLFYIGQAKDRLPQLLSIFERASLQGLKCEFYIVGVDEKDMKFRDQIHYNEPLPYHEVIKKIVRSKCLVEAKQGNSTAPTIKICEAVIYDKKIITTNDRIVEEPFYNKNDILITKDFSEDIGKFLMVPFVRYSDEGKDMFSPYSLFKKIDSIITNRK